MSRTDSAVNMRTTRHIRPRTGLFVVCAALLLATTAVADAVGVRKYSFASLDTFWRNQVAAQPLTSLTPALLRTNLGPSAPPLSSTDPVAPVGTRRARGWTPPSEGTGSREGVYFHILTTDPTLDAELLTRQLAFAMFLNKSDVYEADAIAPVTADGGSVGAQMIAYEASVARSDEQTRAIKVRRYSARIELFLIALMRYYAVETIAEKCSRLKELKEQLAQIDAAKPEVAAILTLPALVLPAAALALEPRFVDLETLETEVATRFRTQIADGKACLVTAVSTRNEDLAAASGQLEALLIRDLTTPSSDPTDPTKITLKDTIAAINAKQAELDAVKGSLGQLDPHANDLLELEIKLGNAKSNFDMVQGDGLGARQKVADMDARVHVSEIQNVSSIVGNESAGRRFDKLGTLADKLCGASPCAGASVFGALRAYLTVLHDAPSKVPASLQPPGLELAVCSTINPDAYADLTATSVDAAPIVACLDRLLAVVTLAGTPSPLKRRTATVGESLKQLSSLVLCQRQGVRLTNCPN